MISKLSEYFTNKNQETFLCFYDDYEENYHYFDYENNYQSIGNKFVNLFQQSSGDLFETQYFTQLEYKDFYLKFLGISLAKEDLCKNILRKKNNRGIILLIDSLYFDKIFKEGLDVILKECDKNIPILCLFCNFKSINENIKIATEEYEKILKEEISCREYHVESVDFETDKNRIYEIIEWFFNRIYSCN
ncbi:hypothetical protein ABK040_003717 [Willaertia magna]